MRLINCVLFFLFLPVINAQNPDIDQIRSHISESSLKASERFEYSMQLAELYRPFPISKELESEGMPPDHLTIAKEAITWAKAEGNVMQIAKANRFLADYYSYSKDILAFIEIANEMVNTDNFASLQDKHFIYLKLAEAYKETGFFKEYIELTPTLYDIGRQLKLISTHVHEEYNQIAMAYYHIKEYDMARYYFRKSIVILRESERPFAEASISNNIGLSFSKEKQIDSAKYYFNASIRILEKASAEKEGWSNSYNIHFKNILKANIAYLNIYKGEYDTAISAIEDELETALIQKETSTEIQAYHKLAFLFYKKKSYNQALSYLQLAESKIRSGTDNELRINNLDVKAKVLLAKGMQEESDALFLRKNELQDSIASVETKKTARVASVLYEVKKKDLEIKNQQANIALLDAKNNAKKQLMILGSIGLIGVFSVIVLFRSRRAAKIRQKLQENFSQGLINAQEAERSRLALDLHDSVGQQLMMITRKSKNNGDESMEGLATSTLQNLRAISRNLHPSSIEQLGFTQAVEDFVNSLDAETDTFFTLELDNVDDQLGKDEALHLYRIIQELLSNMIKHAQAKSAEISLKKTNNNLKLVVKDSGVGFDLNNALKTTKSLGMKSIKERCKILNAKLSIVSKPNIGTKISVVIPI